MRRQRRQETVESSVLELPGTRGGLPLGGRGVRAVAALDQFGKRLKVGHGAPYSNRRERDGSLSHRRLAQGPLSMMQKVYA
jgi:hypothetical protein